MFCLSLGWPLFTGLTVHNWLNKVCKNRISEFVFSNWRNTLCLLGHLYSMWNYYTRYFGRCPFLFCVKLVVSWDRPWKATKWQGYEMTGSHEKQVASSFMHMNMGLGNLVLVHTKIQDSSVICMKHVSRSKIKGTLTYRR